MRSETGSCTPESKASVETDPRTPEREASVSDSDASSSSETSSVTLGRRSPRPDTPASPPPTETNSSIQNVGDRAPKIYVTDPFLGGRRRRLMIDDMYDKMRQEHPEKWENCYWRRHRLVEQQRETKTTMNPTPMK